MRGESEVIMKKGTEYRVIRIDNEPDITDRRGKKLDKVIYLEEV